MGANSKTDQWEPPVWHPDWGDTEPEFVMLRDLAARIVERFGDRLDVVFNSLEEGYMNVEVLLKDHGKLGEFYADADDGSFGLFVGEGDNEIEHQLSSTDAVLAAIDRHLPR